MRNGRGVTAFKGQRWTARPKGPPRPYTESVQPSLWLALAGAGVLISFTPGAGAINTMSNSLNSGFRRSIWGILGQQAALIVHVVIVALGVGVLVASSPVAFNVIRYAGAAYLVYLGIQQFRHKPDLDQEKAPRCATSRPSPCSAAACGSTC